MISYEFVDDKTFRDFFPKMRVKLFKDDLTFDPSPAFSDEEFKKLKVNAEKLRAIQKCTLVAKEGDQIVGWSHGIQKGNADFVMQNSAVLETHRRMGIYSELLKRSVERVAEMGFQRIYSRHKMSNNAVIIPKLKFGFVITGMDITDTFGACVVLSYFTHPVRKEMLLTRIGERRIGKDLEKFVV